MVDVIPQKPGRGLQLLDLEYAQKVPPASTEMASKDDEVPELEQIEHRLD
jgi:hypothetical protein